MEIVDVDGMEVAYLRQGHRSGSAPALVFAHALGASHSLWAAQVEAFAADYDCIAYDVRGHGQSGVPPGPYRIEQLADDARGLIDALGLAPAVFVGVSMGGMIGMQLALSAPDRVRGLVVADSAASFSAEGRKAWADRIAAVTADGIAPQVPVMMGRWFTEAFRNEQPQRVAAVAEVLKATPVDGYLACCAALRDLELLPRLAAIRCPTLVVCGENDPSTPLPLSQAIAAAIPGARLEVVAGMHHLPNVEVPETFNSLLREFLRQL